MKHAGKRGRVAGMISRKKAHYPISPSLWQYLYHFGRYSEIPMVYEDLLRFSEAMPYEAPNGEETLWLTVSYPQEVMQELRPKLTKIYAALKVGGEEAHHEHLVVDRIDFGEFGNSRPFRVRITNQYNDNSDYYYVKPADASRIFGLELEYSLSPNLINYLVRGNTLIEEHIVGVPGDAFIQEYLPRPSLDRVRVAKEFIKFIERCFIRLLGDMRSVNYVVQMTPDFEKTQYRIWPIDFDQQSHNGKAKVYMAYHNNSNKELTRMSFREINRATIAQYAEEERTQMVRRAVLGKRRLKALLKVMENEELSPIGNVYRLREELGQIHQTMKFEKCTTMGQLTQAHIQHMLENDNFSYHRKRSHLQ